MKNFLLSVGGAFFSFILAGGSVLLISKILDLTESTMTWYLKSWIIAPLYGCPIIFSMAIPFFLQTFSVRILIFFW